MIETIMLIVVIFVLSGVFWYSFFYQKESKRQVNENCDGRCEGANR